MNIADLMTPDPVTISASAPLSEALGTLEELGIRHLPVVVDEAVVGVISDRDLLQATGWMWNEEQGKAPSIVADVVRSQPVTVSPDASVAVFAQELVECGIGCAPVVEGNRLVGIVTELDVLHALTSGEAGELVEGNPAHGADADEDEELEAGEATEGHTVGDRMTREVLTLELDATAQDALDLLQDAHVRHLPVVDDGQLCGLVSDRDLRRVLGRALHPTTPVREFMSVNVQTAEPTDDLRSTARTMAELKIGGLPVVEGGELVGMITITDLLAYCAGHGD